MLGNSQGATREILAASGRGPARMVTHDRGAATYADGVITMQDGRIA
jgi:ABC-type lipoprotein export system ATPase subunit